MQSIIHESGSLEGVLIAALAFWVIALFGGDYGWTLQHAFFCQRIIQTNSNIRSSDSPNLQYCNFLSKASLDYFRATRGPCLTHPSMNGGIMSCSARWFTPEDYPLHVQVVDTLHHLRRACYPMTACGSLLTSLDANAEHQSHNCHLVALLENSLRKAKYLICRWSDHKHLGLASFQFEREVHEVVSIPCTVSPFQPVLSKINQAIGSHSHSDVAIFSDVEHPMHDASIMPNLCIATSCGHPEMLRDFGFLVFLGNKAHEDLVLQNDFKGLVGKEPEWTTDAETRLWNEFMASVKEARTVR